MNQRLLPLVLPLAAIAATGIIIFVISRILLSFTKTTTPPVALGIAMAILIVCSIVAGRVQSNPR